MTLATYARLSDRQQQCLRALEARAKGSWIRSGHFGCRTNTLDSLVELGLVERRLYDGLLLDFNWEWRINDEGRSILPEWARR